MATYAIGDIQGCYRTLLTLLETLPFDRRHDRLWLVGDLVNRGPSSAEVIRWAMDLGDRVDAVLGNHDLHLLARAAGGASPKKRDTIEDVLAAPDRDDLIAWISGLPLLRQDEDRILVHAGLLPEWSLDEAKDLAREVEAALRDERRAAILARPPAKEGEIRWDPALSGIPRLRTALAAFTMLRLCHRDGTMLSTFSGPPSEAPPGWTPWFSFPRRKAAPATIVFGHWSALGLHMAPTLVGLDTGCVWGGKLTAVRLEDRAVFAAPCDPQDRWVAPQ